MRQSKGNVLTLHEKFAEIGTRLDFCVLYPFRALKAIGFDAGCKDIKLAVKIFHQTFNEKLSLGLFSSRHFMVNIFLHSTIVLYRSFLTWIF